MKRVLVVADISNLYYCIKKKYNCHKLNYRKYLAKAVGEGMLYRAIGYGAQMDNEADKFFECLKLFGFDLKIKKPQEYINREDGIDIKTRKADWDVGIAMDVVRHINRVDVVVLGSADGDMVPLVLWIKDSGVRCVVIASGVNNGLKDCADAVIEIGPELLEHKDEIKDEHSAEGEPTNPAQ